MANKPLQSIKFPGLADTYTVPQIDDTLSVNGRPADAKETGDRIEGVRSDLSNSITLNDNLLANAKWEVGAINVTTGADTYASTVYRTDYIEIGDMESVKLHIDSGYKFFAVFINAEKTAVVHTVNWTVSDKDVDISTITGAKYLRILYKTTSDTLPSSFSYITATYKTKLMDAAKKSIEFIKDPVIEFVSGNFYNCVTHAITPLTNYSYTKIPIALFNGGKISGRTGIIPDSPAYGIAFTDANDNYISSEYSTNTGHYEYDYDILIPDNTAYVYINLRDESSNLWIAPTFPWSKIIENIQKLSKTKDDVENLQRVTSNEIVPRLRNGSVGNGSNANAVTSEFISPIPNDYDYLMIQFTGNTANSNQYGFTYTLFHGATDGMSTTVAFADSGITKKSVNSNFDAVVPETVPHIVIPASELTGYEHISVAIFRKNNGTYVPIRIDTEQYCVKLTFGINASNNIIQRGITNNDILKKANDARHIKGNAATPLTILHFSDLHKDINAMNRIMEDAESFGDTIDSVICTGDMVLNSYEQIASWWNPNVMTCIGNHDSASYSSDSGYNWTALSMANRDAYYIAPFESNWGIVHTSGTSYYYKDYAESKVRLIVMDAMLYSDNGQEANTQTAWLENLLESAITGDLHVLIAIHAPHGGATVKKCSFSRYNQTAWTTQADCNTPQAVIDTVATAISSGLKFIGYLIGHTHQDNIWDAEDDGTQLMYCVTCAIVSQEAQWKNSDQYRDANNDAYNIVTIDTTNMLVKIVRGGGADIDDHMRNRKAICFNYSTGEVVGEVL